MQQKGPSEPQGFVVQPRRLPKAEASVRVRDFGEIIVKPTTEALETQAGRCTDCGVPFCQNACPLQNNIPDWLNLAAEDDLREAWRVASSTSTMPEICGRICPQDRLCEGACTLNQSGWEAVTIGSVEPSSATRPSRTAGSLRSGRRISGASVGIVGAGPAGLAAADRLREQGYAVTVYDRHDRPGGLLIYGIPGFKLEKAHRSAAHRPTGRRRRGLP
jgi:glutamate synthase (NADPH/NADH) small chain